MFAASLPSLLALPAANVADGVGDWTIRRVWHPDCDGDRPDALFPGALFPDPAEAVLALGGAIADSIDLTQLQFARIFGAADGGYVRPHCDWADGVPKLTRLHIPLSSNPRAVSSEDAVVYRMEVGEIWLLDGGRPHSGGCFGPEPRLHLVLDFPPDLDPHALLSAAALTAPARPVPIERPGLSRDDMAAIVGLADLVGEASFDRVVALLGAVHFRRNVSCAALYDWLDVIAGRSGQPCLVERSRVLRAASLGPQRVS